MELLFLLLLFVLMAIALGSGYPVAFALPGAAVVTMAVAALTGWLLEGNADSYFLLGGPNSWLSAGVTNMRGIYWDANRDTLIAIPLFIFMGIMLQRSKIAEDLLVTMAQLFGPIPGGLGISVVFVGALLAATTGIVGATVVAMGLISLPAMLRNNYSQSLATGTIAASGTLGQIIPPSIVLIILADQLANATDQASTIRKNLYTESTGDVSMPSQYDVSSTSAGEMFMGALAPGFLLVGLYMLFILAFALLRPSLAPAVPYEGERNAKFWGNVAFTLIPPLALIFLVLGSIILGISTVNQAGAIGAAGALVMAGYRLSTTSGGWRYVPALVAILSIVALGLLGRAYDLNVRAINPGDDLTGIYLAAVATVTLIGSLVWSAARVFKIDNTLHEVMLETAKTAALVFVILLGAVILVSAFRAFGGEHLVMEFLSGLPGGFWTQFLIVMLVIFVLGFFLDFIEIAVVVVPIVAPILLSDPSANITAVWLGVMIGLNIQTSFLTPPFGFALFYLRGVAPAVVRTVNMYKGVIAFITLQLIALVVVGLHPPLVNYLPNRVNLTSETAPPPRNPRLQACVEDYVLQRILTDESSIRGAIQAGRSLDRSYLPDDLQRALVEGFDNADEAIRLLKEADVARQAVKAAEGAYLPVQRVVRGLERDIRRIDAELSTLGTTLRRLREGELDRAPQIEARMAELTREREALVARKPANWEETFAAFRELEQAEDRLRNTYRRSGERSVEAASTLAAALAGTGELRGLLPEIEALATRVEAGEDDAVLLDAASALRDRAGAIEGAGDVRSALHAARQALRGGDRTDRAAASAALGEAAGLIDGQMSWRTRAETELMPGLQTYVAEVSGTVGVRSLSRMPRDMALFVASCEASHRDLSVHF